MGFTMTIGRTFLSRAALVLSLLLWVSSAFAAQIIIDGESTLTVESREGGEFWVSGEYRIRNNGDELAKHVYPIFELDGPLWSGDPRNINPKEETKWSVGFRLTGAKDGLPLKGAIPLRVTRYYQDQNSYRFSARDFIPLATPDLTESERTSLMAPQISPRMTIVSTGQRFEGYLELRNTSNRVVNPSVALWTSLELQTDDLGDVGALAAGQIKKLEVSGRNYSALDGSRYPLAAIIEWADNGLRHSTVVYSSVDVFPEDYLFERKLAVSAVIAMALVALLIVIRRRLNKSEQELAPADR